MLSINIVFNILLFRQIILRFSFFWKKTKLYFVSITVSEIPIFSPPYHFTEGRIWCDVVENILNCDMRPDFSSSSLLDDLTKTFDCLSI